MTFTDHIYCGRFWCVEIIFRKNIFFIILHLLSPTQKSICLCGWRTNPTPFITRSMHSQNHRSRVSKCRILGFKPSRVSTVYYSRWVAARLVLRKTLYIYGVNHLSYMYRINYFNKSYQAVNISELGVRGFGKLSTYSNTTSRCIFSVLLRLVNSIKVWANAIKSKINTQKSANIVFGNW